MMLDVRDTVPRPRCRLATAGEPDATEAPDWDLGLGHRRPMGRAVVPRQRPARELVTGS